MTLVCPTLRTVAVGVTRAGRHDGGRRLADGNRMSVPGGALLLCGAAKRNRAVPRSGLNSGVFRFAFSVICPMARLLLRLPTRASHYNMAIKPMESGAGKLRGRDHDDMLCR